MVVAGSAWGVNVPPHMEALRQQVEGEALRLEQQLQGQEEATDYRLLLSRKLTVDCSLAPLVLQEDGAAFVAAVAAGREPPDLLRLLRAEYGREPLVSTWSTQEAPKRVAAALAGWAARTDGSSACAVQCQSVVATSSDSAPLICWTLHAMQGAEGPRASATAHWYEPCVDTRTLDWPLNPFGLQVSWDGHRGNLATGSGVTHSEAWPQQPRFNNPNDIYALFDLLRARNCADQQLTRSDAALPSRAGGAELVERTLQRADGSPVRRETWEFHTGRLTHLHIQQWPLRLQHHAPHVFELRQSVGGVELGSAQTVQPQSVLVLPAMEFEVDFRSVDPARDSLEEPMVHSATVPARMRITAEGRTVAQCEFKGWAAGVGPAGEARVQRALHEWGSTAHEQAAARAQCMTLAEGAFAAGNVEKVHTALAGAAQRNLADGVSNVMNAANAAVCVRRLEEAGHHGAAARVATTEWLPAVMARESAERVLLGARALESGSAALGRVVAGPLADASPEVEELMESGEHWRTFPPLASASLSSCAPECQSGPLPQQSSLFLEAVGQVLTAECQRAHAPLSLPLAHAFERCAASAVHEAARQGILPHPTQVERTTQDLRAAFRHGRGELSADWLADPANECVACYRFSRRVTRALRLPPPSDHERQHLQEAVLIFGQAGSRVAQELAEQIQLHAVHAKEASRLVLEMLQFDAHLVGNAFEPRFLRWPSPKSQGVDSAEEPQLLPNFSTAMKAIRAAVESQASIGALRAEQQIRQQSRVPFGRRMPHEANDAESQPAEPPPDGEQRRAKQVADATARAARSAFEAWYAALSRSQQE